MHYLACFTLFDGDPGLINTVLDGFLAVTPEQIQDVARRYLVRTQRAIVYRLPAQKAAQPEAQEVA
jgi:predicted Zn-dependent peptidase